MTSYAVFGSDRDDRDRARVRDDVRAAAQARGSSDRRTFVTRIIAAARHAIAA